MSKILNNRTALITGAARGIGKSIAENLAKAILNCIDEKRNQLYVSNIIKAKKTHHLYVWFYILILNMEVQ